MRALFFACSGLLLVGCPKPPAIETAPIETAPRIVRTGADLAGAQGTRATLYGELARRTPQRADATEGTAVVLEDGTAVFVSDGAPPEGWEWLLGTQIQIQGSLWERAPEGGAVPWLADLEIPMPADGGMPMFTP